MWQIPIFTRGILLLSSATYELNFCVRDGNRCDLVYIFTRNVSMHFYITLSSYIQIHIEKYILVQFIALTTKFAWLSPRPISSGQLNTLLHLHSQPIKHVCLHVALLDYSMRYLILWRVSHLDAFSVYPFQTWLLSYATGVTTDAPSVCPSWSSRTKDSSTQISYACDR